MPKFTQKEAILTALQNGEKITPLEALRDFGCFRLAARIYDIEREGHKIKREMVTVAGRVSGKCRVARYSLSRRRRRGN
jgi:hypothetical protein